MMVSQYCWASEQVSENVGQMGHRVLVLPTVKRWIYLEKMLWVERGRSAVYQDNISGLRLVVQLQLFSSR